MSLSAPEDAHSRRPHSDAGQAADTSALPPGTRLAEFEVLRVLGDGGFGVVYLAHDLSLGRQVAIKEYMPSSLATRHGTQVSLRSIRHAETFAAGLRSFVNEAQLLASFDHPSLVKVYRFWEENGTAYMVMPFYEGITLKHKLKDMGAPPSQAWLLQLLEPLIDALSTIHAQRCYHRDIAPDNIILLAGSGRPLLLDFGAARRVISDMTQALTVILKPGYAPLEQYAEVPDFKQGPWTDVYALCAVVHYAITGRTPPPAVGRVVSDSFGGLADHAEDGYDPTFLRAIERGLRIRPDERTPSVDMLAAEMGLRRAIDLEIDLPDGLSPTPTHTRTDRAIDLELALESTPPPPPEVERTVFEPRAAPAAARAAAAPAATAGSRRWAYIALGALILGGGATWLLSHGAAPGDAAVESPPPRLAVATAPAAEVAAALPAMTAAQRTAREFERIVAAQHADYEVEAAADQARLRIGRDMLSFTVRSNRDGFVYVLVHGPDDSLTLLFPNRVANDNHIRAGKPLQLPQKTWPLGTSDPPGPERFIAIVSAHPRDFSALRPVAEAWFLRLPVEVAAASPPPEGGSALAGVARCGDPGCDRYGAARFTVMVEP